MKINIGIGRMELYQVHENAFAGLNASHEASFNRQIRLDFARQPGLSADLAGLSLIHSSLIQRNSLIMH